MGLKYVCDYGPCTTDLKGGEGFQLQDGDIVLPGAHVEEGEFHGLFCSPEHVIAYVADNLGVHLPDLVDNPVEEEEEVEEPEDTPPGESGTNGEEDDGDSDDADEEDDDGYECPDCGKEFDSRQYRNVHRAKSNSCGADADQEQDQEESGSAQPLEEAASERSDPEMGGDAGSNEDADTAEEMLNASPSSPTDPADSEDGDEEPDIDAIDVNTSDDSWPEPKQEGSIAYMDKWLAVKWYRCLNCDKLFHTLDDAKVHADHEGHDEAWAGYYQDPRKAMN